MDAANIALQSHVDVKQRSDLFLRAATRLQNPYHYLMIITIMITRRFPVGCKTTISTLTEVLFFALLHLPWHGCFCCVYVLSAMWTIPGRPLLRGRTCVIDFHPIHRSLKWTEQSSHTIRLELSDRCLTYVGLWPDFLTFFFPHSVGTLSLDDLIMLCFRLKTLVDRVLRPRFAAAGLQPGERVAALLPNGPQVLGVEKVVLNSQIQIDSNA